MNNGAPGGGSGSGIEIAPQAGGSARATILNTQIFNGSTNGIRVVTANGAANAVLGNVAISGNANGLVVVAASNGGNVLIEDSKISNNSAAGVLTLGAAARVRVSNTSITANGTGVSAVGGSTVSSFGNNRLIGNGTDGAFTTPNIPSL